MLKNTEPAQEKYIALYIAKKRKVDPCVIYHHLYFEI